MSLIAEIKSRASKYPELSLEELENGVVIHTPNKKTGFSISLYEDHAGDYTAYTVAFGNWHGHFDTEEEASEFVAMGLSDQCRLREISWGTEPYKWIVESQQEGKWIVEQVTGSLFFPFWKAKSEKVFQNSII